MSHFLPRVRVSLIILVMFFISACAPGGHTTPNTHHPLTPGIVTEFPLPHSGARPLSLAAGEDGNLWFVENTANNVGMITPSGKVTEYPLPTGSTAPVALSNSYGQDLCYVTSTGHVGDVLLDGSITESVYQGNTLSSIVQGGDINEWITDITPNANKIGYTTTSSSLTEFDLSSSTSLPGNLVTGWDGSVWFTEYAANKIVRITSSAGAMKEYALPDPQMHPTALTAGPDGNMWFTAINNDGSILKVGKLAADGTISEYAVPLAGAETGKQLGFSESITTGPDGNLWFTEIGTGKIVSITTAGVITQYALPRNAKPQGLTSGPDGALWFTEPLDDKIGRITTTTAIREQSAPDLDVNGSTRDAYNMANITADAKHNLWYTENYKNNIAKLAPDGGVVAFPIPSASDVTDIVGAAGGGAWFTETSGIGHIAVDGTIKEYPVSNVDGNIDRIAMAPDGGLRFAVHTDNGSPLGNLAPNGTVTNFSPNSPEVPDIRDIVVAPDNTTWFTDHNGMLGSVSATGKFTVYPLNTSALHPDSLAIGPDGNLWFTAFHDDTSNWIGRMTPQGTNQEWPIDLFPVLSDFSANSSGSAPDIVNGPDGNLWYSDGSENALLRITPSGTITRLPMPTSPGAEASGMTVAQGTIYVLEPGTSQLATITP